MGFLYSILKILDSSWKKTNSQKSSLFIWYIQVCSWEWHGIVITDLIKKFLFPQWDGDGSWGKGELPIFGGIGTEYSNGC